MIIPVRCFTCGKVAVDGTWKVCPYGGGPIQFPGFNAYHELCRKGAVVGSPKCPKSCNFNGECINGKCKCFPGFCGQDCSTPYCPNNCKGHGRCLSNGFCECGDGYTGLDCSTATCNEECSRHGGVCDNGRCEFRCSDYAGYTCQNSSKLALSLGFCRNVLKEDLSGQHCAPSETTALQQLEDAVVKANYNRLFPRLTRPLKNFFDDGYCDSAAKQLACWLSIQKCDKDGDNRLRVCYSACIAYNNACGALLDCSDQTLFSNDGHKGLCKGGESKKTQSWLGCLVNTF